MERRRLLLQQQQRFKEQQRCCISQQDLTEAIARMKPTLNGCRVRRRATLADASHMSTLSSSMEGLTNSSVSQLIRGFEARTTAVITPYASARDLLPIVNDDDSCNRPESNRSHMPRTAKIKGTSNENDIINNNVCSSISRFIDDDNRMITVEGDQHQVTGDREHDDDDDDAIHQPPPASSERHKQECPTSSSSSVSVPVKNSPRSSGRHMATTRSTDIDAAASAMGNRHEIQLDDLLTKETQLNNALADLLSISTDQQQQQQPRRKNSISASIDLLNNLLETFDQDKAEGDTNQNPVKPINMFCVMLSDNVCANCHQVFATNEQIVNAAGQIWHTHCFVCTQCFQPFENGIYYEHEDRKYCERDFQMLFAPCCAECQQAVVGRVIRALHKCFHPDCFRCQVCRVSLVEIGFAKHNGRALCRDCLTKEKANDPNVPTLPMCTTCHQVIDGKCLKYRGEVHHPAHFQCSSCRINLDETYREARGSLYCLSCHNQLDLPVCAACRRFIDDRVINALGKQWHVEHFCCARCSRPFYGNKHYENQGLAYCEFDYKYLFGSTCFVCNHIITENVYTTCEKKFCAEHFTCSVCEKKLHEKGKFFDVDATPVCKQCYAKLSSDVRQSLRQACKFLPVVHKQTSV